MCIRDSHPTRGDRDAPHLTERRWWPPLGRSHGHQRAVFMTATGQFLLALDTRILPSQRCVAGDNEWATARWFSLASSPTAGTVGGSRAVSYTHLTLPTILRV